MHNCIKLSDIKIIEYNEKYSKEINDFINWSMYNFIGRKFKQREDLIDINEYYIKNGGNFWRFFRKFGYEPKISQIEIYKIFYLFLY